MREIEVKAKVASGTAIAQKIWGDGVTVSEPVTQRDQVFGVPGVDGGSDNHSPWLRIRTETDGATKYLFTLKRSVTSQLDSIEHEIEITDPHELEQIIHHMGYVPYSDSIKTRSKAKVGEIEVCIDNVEGLGEFVEAEKMCEENVDPKEVIEELWQTLERYGANRTDEVTDGYDVMIKNKEKEAGAVQPVK